MGGRGEGGGGAGIVGGLETLVCTNNKGVEYGSNINMN